MRSPNQGAATFIDLFAGCGGLSLGFMKAGLECVAAVDFDKDAVETMRRNFPKTKVILQRDLTAFGPADLSKMIGIDHVDIIAGGPPCQGYSTARQRDGANHGSRLIHDPRRTLYREFLKFVAYFRPSIFVMENVLGIRSADGGRYFSAVQAEARKLGYRVHGEEVLAWRFGVPQKRVRQLIVGTLEELPIFVAKQLFRETHALEEESDAAKLQPAVMLGEAIGDLPALSAGDGQYECDYDLRRRSRHIAKYGDTYLKRVLEVDSARYLTGHVSRPHNARDLRDFGRLKEGEHCGAAISRGEQMEFPYDRDNFKDRYTRQHRKRLCSTIVAHLSKDGLMFIHPEQRRSLTPREAARIQSFPDWFVFPRAQTHAFRMIGNAIPPLVAKAIGKGVGKYLGLCRNLHTAKALPLIPKSSDEAIECLETVLKAASGAGMKSIERKEFLKAWFSIGYLFPRLHPDSASSLTRADVLREDYRGPLALIGPMLGQVSTLSGWPLGLVAMAKDASRRCAAGEISVDDYYFSAAQQKGRQEFTAKGAKAT